MDLICGSPGSDECATNGLCTSASQSRIGFRVALWGRPASHKYMPVSHRLSQGPDLTDNRARNGRAVGTEQHADRLWRGDANPQRHAISYVRIHLRNAPIPNDIKQQRSGGSVGDDDAVLVRRNLPAIDCQHITRPADNHHSSLLGSRFEGHFTARCIDCGRKIAGSTDLNRLFSAILSK
ncbi:MAG: hypothetical protein ACJAZO_002875 [Myxococcota bacterium]|jgi:hypothetical protein